ncbi:MAG: hypothetical protein DCO99_03545 [Synechococcus sp. XM-24]|nr:MAG: hypothetical protein DCO99_03545 [Synechococcus sp. XM-24]
MKEPSILDDLAAKHGWADRDPMTLTEPLKRRRAPRQCHCSQASQTPRLDLSERLVRCACCRQEIPKSCRRRDVVWLRGLLRLEPDQLDVDSIAHLLFT